MDDVLDGAIRKAARWPVPFLCLLYLVNYLDRVNISFAALTMNSSLRLSATVFGIGAGVFFVDYLVCEVPSNLVLARVGARRWIGRIMVTWGMIAVAMAACIGIYSTLPIFWTLPGRFLTGPAIPGAFALITFLGNLSGIVIPPIVGWTKDATSGFTLAMVGLAYALVLAGLLAFGCRPPRQARLRPAEA